MEKAIRTNLQRYGVMYSFQREDVKRKCKETNLKNRNVEYPAQSAECWNAYRETCKERYGYEYPTQSPEIQNQIQLTKKINGTYGRSHEEDEVYNILKFIFPRLKRQYKSEVYPFNCDFYDPDNDIYFEYNGFMTHGNHFFNPNYKSDIETLNRWKLKAASGKPLYQASIDTWTRYDVEKRETASRNHLNYIVFWKVKEAREYVMNFSKSKQ